MIGILISFFLEIAATATAVIISVIATTTPTSTLLKFTSWFAITAPLPLPAVLGPESLYKWGIGKCQLAMGNIC